MSDKYRERLSDVLQNAESYPRVIPHDICKLKVLVHIWMTIDLKAEFVKGNGADTETVDGDHSTDVPANWHKSDINNLDATYKYAGRTLYFAFAYNKRSDNYVISVVDNITRYSESAFINKVPGDCSEENAVEDELIITDIIRQLYRWIDAFMEAVQSPEYTPRTPADFSTKKRRR